MENSAIAWTDNTFNPWMGCEKVSQGCKNCYAATFTKNRMGKPELWNGTRQVTSKLNWNKPWTWNRKAEKSGIRSRVFCGSLCDVFEDHSTVNKVRPTLWDLIRDTTFLDWQLLTKRPERILSSLPEDWGEGYPNVWLGTSIEDMEVVHRADTLREVPVAVRFISYEPAIGPLDDLDLEGIHWVIYGGESGPGHREHNPDWARSMRDKCLAGKVAFFFKQSSGSRPGTNPILDGETIKQYPR